MDTELIQDDQAGASEVVSPRYTMTISRLTVDKLGVKLYDKASAVIAELVANSYDADAKKVLIRAPMGTLLARKKDGVVADEGHVIEVIDWGHGMSPEEVNRFFLRVGAERRSDPLRGDYSKIFHRRVMGRKGVGKLAPFGICSTIEVISSGGNIVEGVGQDGNPISGYLTAHFTMNKDDILDDKQEDYHPEPGAQDGQISKDAGTIIRLSHFERRRVPEFDVFSRQLAQRFGIKSENWQIELEDTTKRDDEDGKTKVVGAFDVEKMENTEIRFVGPEDNEAHLSGSVSIEDKDKYCVIQGEDGIKVEDLNAGFEYEGKFYPVIGWIAYSKQSYRDELMAGVRIYCRGKIAAQTSVFNRGAGFTGEHNIRSYLVGEIFADWLDEGEDLIQTDRKDIIWSDELGECFEIWGQNVVLALGKRARNPLKKRAWEQFLEVTQIKDKIEQAFTGPKLKSVRDKTLRLAKAIGESYRPEQLEDSDQVDSMVNLVMMFGPHVELDEALLEAGKEEDSPLSVVVGILERAKVAELSSFGLIAEKRVRVIQRLEALKDDPNTIEQGLQELIEEAPWLINPQWSPIIENQSLSTLKSEFEKYYEKQTGSKISLQPFRDSKKRPDFVMSGFDGLVQIIEIKQPGHRLGKDEWLRIRTYIENITSFLNDPANAEFKRHFTGYKITLVCDELGLTGDAQDAYRLYEQAGSITLIGWKTFLLRARQMHEEFLEKYRQLKEIVGRDE